MTKLDSLNKAATDIVSALENLYEAYPDPSNDKPKDLLQVAVHCISEDLKALENRLLTVQIALSLDEAGVQNMTRLKDVKEGDYLLISSDVVPCCKGGAHLVHKSKGGNLHVKCEHGNHFLASMVDEESRYLEGVISHVSGTPPYRTAANTSRIDDHGH